MSDLIYKDDALDALLQCHKHCIDPFDSYHIDIEDAEARIRRLPSADPGLNEWCTDCKEYDQKRHCCPRFNRVIRETLADMKTQKIGRWIWQGFNIECSECGAMPDFDSTEPLYRFCPNCGARMERRMERYG